MRFLAILPAGLLLWLAPAAGKPPANDGLPKRWAGTTDVYVKNVLPLRTHSVVTFTLTKIEPQVGRTVYHYRPTGTIDVAASSGSDGRCTYSNPHKRLAIPSERGQLLLTVTKLPNGRRRVTYYGYGDTLFERVPFTISCPSPDGTTTTFTDAGAWFSTGGDRPTAATATILRGTYAYPNGTGVWKHCLARNAKDAENCKAEELQAIATTDGAVRGGTVTLDGSKSKKDIKSYTWELSPGADCPSGTTLRTTTLTGAKVSFTLLCSLEATLTVSDGSDEDSTTIDVPVRPRPWKTPFARRSVDGGPGAPTALPSSTCVSGTCTASIDGGINLPDCPGAPQPGSAIICPLLNGGSTWLDHGYTLATVADPKGPFDGFSYVASSTLEVKRVELINANLLPGGARERDGNTFYGFNQAKGADVAGFVAAIRHHEGLGAPGRPQTGHSGIIQAALQAPTGDPRRQIEKLIAPAASDVQRQADEALRDLDTTIDGNSADPLPTIWTGTLWFWDDYAGIWRSGTITVP